MHSHHSHSGQFCRHAAAGTTLEDVVRAAIDKGFTTYGLSEHCPRYRQQDLYPEEEDLTAADLRETFKAYLVEAHHLKAKYAQQIDLLVGLETDYITALDIEQLEHLLSSAETAGMIEYVVGSVHHVAEQGIDFSKEWWETCLTSFQHADSQATTAQKHSRTSDLGIPFSATAVTAYLHAYLDAQHRLITAIQPSVIGHFDLCRLYVPSLPLDSPSLPGVWDKVQRNIRAVVAYDGMFEVSAASFRKGWDDGYPGKEVLQCILAHKGRLCLSDDSHGPKAVALNYLRLRDYLLAEDVTELWYLASRPAEHTPVAAMPGGAMPWLDIQRQKVTARRYEGNWADDEFWARLEKREEQMTAANA